MRFLSFFFYFVAAATLLMAIIFVIAAWLLQSGDIAFDDIQFRYKNLNVQAEDNALRLDMTDIALTDLRDQPLLLADALSVRRRDGAVSVSITAADIYLNELLPRRQTLYNSIIDNLALGNIAFLSAKLAELKDNLTARPLIINAVGARLHSDALPFPLANVDLKLRYADARWQFHLDDRAGGLAATGSIADGDPAEFAAQIINLPAIADLPLALTWGDNQTQISGVIAGDAITFTAAGVAQNPRAQTPGAAPRPLRAAEALWQAGGVWRADAPLVFTLTTALELRDAPIPDRPAVINTLSVSGVWQQANRQWQFATDNTYLANRDITAAANFFVSGDSEGVVTLIAAAAARPFAVALIPDYFGSDFGDRIGEFATAGTVSELSFHLAASPRNAYPPTLNLTARLSAARLQINDQPATADSAQIVANAQWESADFIALTALTADIQVADFQTESLPQPIATLSIGGAFVPPPASSVTAAADDAADAAGEADEADAADAADEARPGIIDRDELIGVFTVAFADAALRATATVTAFADRAGVVSLAGAGAVAPFPLPAAADYISGELKDWYAAFVPAGQVSRADFFVALAPRAAETTPPIIRVTAHIADAHIRIYRDNWPLVTAVAATLAINGDDLRIIGSGYYGDLFAQTIDARIPRLSAPAPTLALNIISERAATESFFVAAEQTRVITAQLARATAQLALAGGAAALSLTIQVPIFDYLATRVTARWMADDVAVTRPPLQPLRDAALDLRFTNDSVSGTARGVYGSADSSVVTVRLAPGALTAAGVITARDVLTLTRLPAFTVTGALPFTLTASQTLTTFVGDLAAVAIDLPPPLALASGESAQISIDISGQDSHAQYARAAVTLNLASNPRGTNIGLNAPAPIPVRAAGAPETNLRGHGASVDIDRWLNLGGSRNMSRLAAVTLTLTDSTFLKTVNPRFTLRQTTVGDERRVVIAATHIGGALTLRGGQISGRLATLRLSDSSADSPPPPPDSVIAAPRLDLAVDIDSFAYSGVTLGAAQVRTAPRGDSWQIHRLQIVNPAATLSIVGQFENDHTYLTVALGSDSGEELLRIFGIHDFIENSQVSLFGIISWRGAYDQFSLRQMRGEMRLGAQNVVYKNLSLRDNLLNFLGIFSPTSLLSALGFDEITQIDRLIFRQVNGDITLADGVAATDGILMQSNDMSIQLAGNTDYVNQTHHLSGSVFPGKKVVEAGEALGLGTGLLALEPTALIIGTILTKMFGDAVARVGSFDYTITGPWSSPIYTEGATPPPQIDQ